MDTKENYEYVEKNFNSKVISSKPHVNCYSSGVDEYSRKDGLPLTKDDLVALSFRGFIVGNEGDMKVQVMWSWDSSD